MDGRLVDAGISGRARLHYAAFYDDVEAVTALLAAGESPDQRDNQGLTPLHLAAQQYAIAAAQALLDAGAQVDAADMFGNTPLIVAVNNSEGRGELIRLLRSHGAEPHHVNSSGRTPVGLARLTITHDVGRFFEDLTDSQPRPEPLVVPEDEMDFDSELIFSWRGALFTGIGYENHPTQGRGEVAYQNGCQTGLARDWYLSGVLQSEAHYFEGSLHRMSREYDSAGVLVEESRWEFGIQLFRRAFGPGGEVIEFGELEPGSGYAERLQRYRERYHHWPT